MPSAKIIAFVDECRGPCRAVAAERNAAADSAFLIGGWVTALLPMERSRRATTSKLMQFADRYLKVGGGRPITVTQPLQKLFTGILRVALDLIQIGQLKHRQLLLLVLACAPAAAEFPQERPIRLVTPYGAGGGIDVAARILSSVAEAAVGTRVDVVNMPGAGGLTAASFVLDAEADGYTLLISDYSPLITLPMREDTPYKIDDWIPLVQVTEIAPTFVVNETSSFASLADLIHASRSMPGELAATHGSYMSSSHLPLLRLEQVAGIDFNHVPTSGGGETFQFLLGRVVSVAVTTPATIAGPARTGRVRPIAVATAERVPALPSTPTLRESGFDIVMPVWYTIFAAAAIADERAAFLAQRISAAYAGDEAQVLAERAGLSILPVTGQALRLRHAETVESVGTTLNNLSP